jgi:hypothetical protein
MYRGFVQDGYTVYIVAAIIVMFLFWPLYLYNKDPEKYGINKRPKRISGESVRKAKGIKASE